MPEFLDYDPVSGITHWFDHDADTNETKITYTQDLSPLVRYTQEMANTGATDKGIKASWWLYAKIPAIVQVKMKAAGIDLHDPGSTKRIIQYINEHYPMLKCTTKNDSGTAPKIYVPK